MNNDPSVINLKDLKRRSEASPVHQEVLASATVVLRPAARRVEEPAPSPAPAPVAVAPVQQAVAPSVPATKTPELPAQPEVVFASKKNSGHFGKKAWIAAYAAGGIVGALLLGFGGYYLYEHVWKVSPFGPTPPIAASSQQAASAATPTSSEASANTAAATSTLSQAEILSRVGKLMLLPQGEEPVLAAVSDTTALSDQAFFKNAKKGDIVLMYGKARRAILYDPANDKVLEVAPITDTPQ